MNTLTKKQKQVFDFIDTYTAENGISPTIEEIRKKLKLKAISTIHEHIDTLKRKGYLSKNANSIRSITTQKKLRTIVDILIVGKIAAGKPIEAIEENIRESISVLNPTIKNSKDYYALRVIGNSMMGEGIFDGDIVVIKKQSVAENGQTVVAIIDGN
ncbi:MAG: transcriptional repressor LexA, partial [bacterium]|nr:transcriptional repressor LexA [bacterium]